MPKDTSFQKGSSHNASYIQSKNNSKSGSAANSQKPSPKPSPKASLEKVKIGVADTSQSRQGD